MDVRAGGVPPGARRRRGGRTGVDNDVLETLIGRIGANILGKRMFEEGEANWPENAPFHGPVFVLTKEKRAPWERKGGTTFFFVDDPIDVVLARAREVAGSKDVRISGGRNVVHQYLAAGLVDELALAIAPVLLGEGLRLFEGLDTSNFELDLVETRPSKTVTHVRYGVRRR